MQSRDSWAECYYWPKPVRTIGIHERAKRAPAYVVRYLVMHELLHIALPPRKNVHHHRSFLVAERLLPCYDRACKWLERHHS
jgi:predicted metal-dependent hydrolase